MKMKIIVCKNGHHYDVESFSSCPFCNEPAPLENVSTSSPDTKTDHGLFSRFFKNRKGSNNHGVDSNSESQTPRETAQPKPPVKDPGTTDVWNDGNNEPSVQQNNEVQPPNGDVPVNDVPSAEDRGTTPSKGNEDPANHQPVTTPSSEDIRKKSAIIAGKTMSYFESASKARENQNSLVAEPPVGWLVCVSGNHFGEVFNIFAGNNAIGRTDENGIVLDKDVSVSRAKHALITYEPKHRQFYVKPGESRGLTYLNNSFIDEPCVLTERDIIEIGKNKLLFVPLCNDSFSWEDYISKE